MICHHKESEEGLLASLIQSFPRVLKICQENEITRQSFFCKDVQDIYKVVMELHKAGDPIDLITISRKFNDNKEISEHYSEEVERIFYSVATPAHAEYYAQQVKDYERRRILQESAFKLASKCESKDHSIAELVAEINGVSKDLVRVVDDRTIAQRIIERHERAVTGESDSVPYPFRNFNQRTGGVRKRMVTVFTGQSKAGKSMFKSFWMRQLGEQNIPVLDLCFEDKEEISMARCASVGRYSLAELDAGGKFIEVHGKWQWFPNRKELIEQEREALDHVSKLPLYFSGRKCTIDQLEARIAYHVEEHGVQMVFVDGAKDIKRLANQYNDCGFEESVSQHLTEIADRYNIAMIPIHHLTKTDPTQTIKVTDIRGSGNIVADSRAVIALQSAGIDKAFGVGLKFDEDGYITSRVLECLANNHGKPAFAVLNSDLTMCNFYEE